MLIELTLISSAASYWLTHYYDKSRTNQALAKNLHSSPTKQFSPKQLFQDVKSALSSKERQQQLNADPSSISQSLQKAQQHVNRNLLISVGTVITAFLGGMFPLFTVLSIIGVLYLSRNMFHFIWRDFQAGRLVSLFLVNGILMLGMLANGHLILAALAGLIGGFIVKIIEQTEDQSKKQLINVFSDHPSRVWLERDGVEIEVDFTHIQVGDMVIVNAGEIVPVDGQIQDGLAIIDQHLLTGESQPVEKAAGDQVFAATLLLSGRLRIQVEMAGEETVAAQIGQVLNNTQHYKDKLIIRGQKIAYTFLPVELGISAVTWLLRGSGDALTVLWSALGANMIYLGPISVLSYLQLLSRRGILVKDGRVLESLRQVDTVIFDKTGTLTLEQPTVGKIHCLGDWDENTLLAYAAAAEYRQSHPIAKAIIDQAASQHLEIPSLDEAHYEVGYGIKVRIDGQLIRVGSARFMSREGIELPEVVQFIQTPAETEGFSLIYLAIEQQLSGILEMHPNLRPEAIEILRYLKQRGMKLYIISGDHEHPTRRMAETLGIEHYFAEVLPENKANLVKQLNERGQFVCFIGDGINDAIALKSAQVSISLKGAATAATDTAQIILMDGTLNHLQQLFHLADEFENTMHSNFLTTIVPGVICISGVYFLHFNLAIGMGIYYIGSVVGLSNTLWPLVKHQEAKPKVSSNLTMSLQPHSP
ncbi:MAG: heavy metal translocating P-type ATPase [Thioploca sp.]|nr:heavy metal translocating P-type ATPase [Thioploca sp.]